MCGVFHTSARFEFYYDEKKICADGVSVRTILGFVIGAAQDYVAFGILHALHSVAAVQHLFLNLKATPCQTCFDIKLKNAFNWKLHINS